MITRRWNSIAQEHTYRAAQAAVVLAVVVAIVLAAILGRHPLALLPIAGGLLFAELMRRTAPTYVDEKPPIRRHAGLRGDDE